MLILFGLVAVFLPSIFCSTCLNGNFTQSIAVEEGQSITLECHVGGNKNAFISWHREPFTNSTNRNITLPNGEISYNGNVLELLSVTRHQSGIYICSVDNEYGIYSRHIKVTVQFKPIIIGTLREDRFESKELELRCNVKSEPPAEVRWYKDHVPVEMSEDLKIITDQEFDDTLKSTLIQSNHNFDHQVTYICEFQNRLGFGREFFEVSYRRHAFIGSRYPPGY